MIKSFKNCEIVQQIRFGFTSDLVQEVCDTWTSIKQYSWIIHDKEVEDPHIHLYLKFKDTVPTESIVNKFNKVAGKEVISYVRIEKIKKNWAYCMAYQVHALKSCADEGKFPYPDDAVHANFDWALLRDQVLDIESGDPEGRIKDAKLYKYLCMIDSGELTRYNYHTILSTSEYVKYYTSIERAFKIADSRRAAASSGSFEVVFISGKPSAGKTSFAVQLCKQKGFTYYISGSENDPLQDYKGEDAVILDDLRPSAFAFPDFLKLLDHNYRSSVASRYFNKTLFCNLICITSCLDLRKFFKGFETSEPSEQFYRRIDSYIVMSYSTISVYELDPANFNFNLLGSFDNMLTYNRLSADRVNSDILQVSAAAVSSSSGFDIQIRSESGKYDPEFFPAPWSPFDKKK